MIVITAEQFQTQAIAWIGAVFAIVGFIVACFGALMGKVNAVRHADLSQRVTNTVDGLEKVKTDVGDVKRDMPPPGTPTTVVVQMPPAPEPKPDAGNVLHVGD